MRCFETITSSPLGKLQIYKFLAIFSSIQYCWKQILTPKIMYSTGFKYFFVLLLSICAYPNITVFWKLIYSTFHISVGFTYQFLCDLQSLCFKIFWYFYIMLGLNQFLKLLIIFHQLFSFACSRGIDLLVWKFVKN